MAKRQVAPKFLKGNQSGFTLMEVMIAIAIFAIFSTVFVTGFGYNLLDSGNLKEDILLKDFAENKINDIITNPPTLADSLTLTKETKDIENNPNYQTIVEYKKFFVPDMTKIAETAGESPTDEDNQQAAMEKRIFAVFKENMEKMIWQVEVTVKNKTTSKTLVLDAWIYNPAADVKIGTF
ncbi:prepilin-type N-terminal cleavage/methylation domain-containing protein [Bacteriovorax sp. PP10]|uniref:Prepilin-type N-terminal cleavage/methylation domain-containing protein n=1 Tax=Bacteriovorax antarcticus TaxID=3088717 RepID=A0ABU5VXZ3_9BACT|nr:prepilin-type N-terminal cleavage/methylation domain-containing protein [Bacteriovorax sp. PP10]MEA9357926.1 prepilin-type N-terminal cleavage/methylation domain-containing protein [Bacteriovorax sp. PP10]